MPSIPPQRRWTSHRVTSAVIGAMYLALAVSIWVRPPVPLPGHTTVFDLVITSATAGAVIGAGAVLLMFSAGWGDSKTVAFGHSVLAVAAFAYGTANLGTSIVNGSGWQVAALCGALTAAHCHYIVRRGA